MIPHRLSKYKKSSYVFRQMAKKPKNEQQMSFGAKRVETVKKKRIMKVSLMPCRKDHKKVGGLYG